MLKRPRPWFSRPCFSMGLYGFPHEILTNFFVIKTGCSPQPLLCFSGIAGEETLTIKVALPLTLAMTNFLNARLCQAMRGTEAQQKNCQQSSIVETNPPIVESSWFKYKGPDAKHLAHRPTHIQTHCSKHLDVMCIWQLAPGLNKCVSQLVLNTLLATLPTPWFSNAVVTDAPAAAAAPTLHPLPTFCRSCTEVIVRALALQASPSRRGIPRQWLPGACPMPRQCSRMQSTESNQECLGHTLGCSGRGARLPEYSTPSTEGATALLGRESTLAPVAEKCASGRGSCWHRLQPRSSAQCWAHDPMSSKVCCHVELHGLQNWRS